MMMYYTQQASSYDRPWVLISVAEEIIFKSSHGQGGNFQLVWCEQRKQCLPLPIQSNTVHFYLSD